MDTTLIHAHKIKDIAADLLYHPYTNRNKRPAQLREIVRRANIIIRRIEKASRETRRSERTKGK